MGFVEGESLAERVRRAGPLSAREAVRLLLDVAYALAYAHGRGVVHRDMKPDNVMIERATGRALLMDFGVARSIGTAPTAQAGMTRVGEVVGTPEYMSPEQATGEEIDGRSDLYSLGLTAYFAVTGNVAYSGDSAARILVRQLTEALPPLASVRPDLPSALADAIDRCLAKDREARYADAAAMIEALDAAQAAAPEIPLAIRLLSNELTVLQTLCIFTLFITTLAVNIVARSGRNLDAFLPCLVMGAVLVGRLLQTRAEVKRIRSAGFSSNDIQRGMVAVLAERGERRQQLHADSGLVAQRRSTVRTGRLLLFGAALSMVAGLRTRSLVDGRIVTPLFGAALIFAAMIFFGLGTVLLVRNPLKAPVDERLFRMLWLGAPGRLLFGFGPAKTTEAASMSTRPARATAASTSLPMNGSSPVDARLSDLEARVRRLEQR
jgi:serine/threonine-protein kinase